MYINDDRINIILDFNERYSENLKTLNSEIQEIIELWIFNKTTRCSDDNPRIVEAELLLFRSIDYLISAIELTKQRAYIESGVIMRLTIETASTAINIFFDDKSFVEYKQNKFKSTNSISFSKKHIKIIGELWGALSELMVHPNTYHGILSQKIENNIIKESCYIDIGIKKPDDFKDKQMILFLRLTTSIILKCFTIVSNTDKNILIDKKIELLTSYLYKNNYNNKSSKSD